MSTIKDKLAKLFKYKELRTKLFFTLFIIIIIRLFNAVPIPGFTAEVLKETTGSNPFSTFYTLITGGRIDSFAVTAIGIGPYINASIIIQLLSSVIPQLEELTKEGGERGKKIIEQYTRYLSLPLAVIQSVVITVLLTSQFSASSNQTLVDFANDITMLERVTMVIGLTAGSLILMWLGELITQRGIGNGSSIVITVGILGSLPSLIKQDYDLLSLDFNNINSVSELFRSETFTVTASLVAVMILMVVGIVFVTESTRKLVIQYARRARGAGQVQNSFLPIKLNQAGVIPVIFASSLLSFPQIIAQFIVDQMDSGAVYEAALKINSSFLADFNSVEYLATYFLLIIAFSFFYAFIVMKPDDVADNLQKSGGFIPGIRPGASTAKYIAQIMVKLTFVGAIFLATIALVPSLFRLAFTDYQLFIFSGIGGTSILIIVGVIIDTFRQIGAYLVTSSYERYR